MSGSYTTTALHSDEITPRISSVSWAAALINDPNWKLISTFSRTPKPSGEDGFFGKTLKTDSTIRTFLSFLPNQETEGEIPFLESRTILDLGPDLDGYPQTAHGGFQAALMDELCGVIVMQNRDAKVEKAQKLGQAVKVPDYYTAYLNTTYKKPLPTPGLLFCTAKIERVEGGDRKIFIRTTLEDGSGTVYTIGEGLFVKLAVKL